MHRMLMIISYSYSYSYLVVLSLLQLPFLTAYIPGDYVKYYLFL